MADKTKAFAEAADAQDAYEKSKEYRQKKKNQNELMKVNKVARDDVKDMDPDEAKEISIIYFNNDDGLKEDFTRFIDYQNLSYIQEVFSNYGRDPKMDELWDRYHAASQAAKQARLELGKQVVSDFGDRPITNMTFRSARAEIAIEDALDKLETEVYYEHYNKN